MNYHYKYLKYKKKYLDLKKTKMIGGGDIEWSRPKFELGETVEIIRNVSKEQGEDYKANTTIGTIVWIIEKYRFKTFVSENDLEPGFNHANAILKKDIEINGVLEDKVYSYQIYNIDDPIPESMLKKTEEKKEYNYYAYRGNWQGNVYDVYIAIPELNIPIAIVAFSKDYNEGSINWQMDKPLSSSIPNQLTHSKNEAKIKNIAQSYALEKAGEKFIKLINNKK